MKNTILPIGKKGGFIMLLIDIDNITKSYGNRLILEIEDLKIYENDRVGIVGNNGVGKTSLLKLIIGEEKPDSGNIFLNGSYQYVSQLGTASIKTISGEMASKFKVPNTWSENLSGGEKTRFKLAGAMESYSSMLLIDEPTNNLDIDGVDLITERLEEYYGGLMVVSHDRSLLDRVCNKIIEIENGKINIYNGNYSDYRIQKDEELERMKFEYDSYINEKRRLENIKKEVSQKSQKVRRTPSRMGNSEARLHRMGGQGAKKNLDKAVKSVESRIEHLEVKDKPREEKRMKIEILQGSKVYNKILLSGKNINKSFEENIIFKNMNFDIYNGKKIGLIGANGSGKTTLINMIINKEKNINIAEGVKIGYFSQDLDILDKGKSILENVMDSSGYGEEFARLLLARLLFRGENVYKKVNLLSGGERVKVSLAKILLQDTNLLILDEPTNYLDIQSMEVLEETLEDYDKTLLIVSHDRKFLENLVDEILIIENKKVKRYLGSYEEYKDKKKTLGKNKDNSFESIMLLENRLNDLIGRLSIPKPGDDIEALDKEYQKTLKELNKIKKN